MCFAFCVRCEFVRPGLLTASENDRADRMTGSSHPRRDRDFLILFSIFTNPRLLERDHRGGGVGIKSS